MISITIDGPGLGVDLPFLLIEKILSEHGYNVIIKNPHPPSEERIKYLTKRLEEDGPQREIDIDLTVHHQVWGG